MAGWYIFLGILVSIGFIAEGVVEGSKWGSQEMKERSKLLRITRGFLVYHEWRLIQRSIFILLLFLVVPPLMAVGFIFFGNMIYEFAVNEVNFNNPFYQKSVFTLRRHQIKYLPKPLELLLGIIGFILIVVSL